MSYGIFNPFDTPAEEREFLAATDKVFKETLKFNAERITTLIEFKMERLVLKTQLEHESFPSSNKTGSEVLIEDDEPVILQRLSYYDQKYQKLKQELHDELFGNFMHAPMLLSGSSSECRHDEIVDQVRQKQQEYFQRTEQANSIMALKELLGELLIDQFQAFPMTDDDF